MVEQNGNAQTGAAQQPAVKPETQLWVERIGTRRYVGRSSRGAEVQIGSDSVDGVFTPGELLKIALAGCTGLSSDMTLASRLGDSFDATVRVSGAADRENERYPELNEVLELDLSELDEAARERLLQRVQRAVDRVCTVGRTLKAGSKVTLTFSVDA
ncbi:MAG: OsmC family protein [Mycobacteriaceae bacterium]|nr:OsmC family protein [Mycobacteriaceae bacterium]